MTKKQEIAKAKLNLTEHRAFWWFIQDLVDYAGPMSNISGNVEALLKLYKEQSKNKTKGKYEQGTIAY